MTVTEQTRIYSKDSKPHVVFTVYQYKITDNTVYQIHQVKYQKINKTYLYKFILFAL